MSWSIIVHGGAGAVKDSLATKHKAGCERAIAAGSEVLRAGGSAVDAACAAVRILEDDPAYNAALGGALDRRGLVTVDAGIMRGSDLGYGAIGGVAGVQRAIDLARAIMDDGQHSLLVGPNAVSFARAHGVPLVDPDLLAIDARKTDLKARLLELAQEGADPAADWAPSEEEEEREAPKGTVGCVARDATGTIAAATSTGGPNIPAAWATRRSPAPAPTRRTISAASPPPDTARR